MLLIKSCAYIRVNTVTDNDQEAQVTTFKTARENLIFFNLRGERMKETHKIQSNE